MKAVFDQNELGEAKLTTVFEMMSTSDDKSIIAGVCVERLIDETDISKFIKSFESQIVISDITVSTVEIIEAHLGLSFANKYIVMIPKIMVKNKNMPFIICIFSL